LHENHIGRAKPGRWKDEFTADQGRWITEYFSPWLVQLGYETAESLCKYLGQASFPVSRPAAIKSLTETSTQGASEAYPLDSHRFQAAFLQSQAS
jgi:hypothetical protein